jgi:ATP-binding cassette, subfamily B, bacterial
VIVVSKRLPKTFQHIAWVIMYCWQHMPTQTGGYFFAAFVRSFVPISLVAISRELVNSVNHSLRTNSSANDAIIWVWLLAFVVFLELFFTLYMRYLSERMYDEITVYVTTDVLTHAGNLPLSIFESPDFQDKLELSQYQIGQRISKFLGFYVDTMSGLIQTITLALAIAYIEPLVLIPALMLGIPYFLFLMNSSHQGFSIKTKQITRRRWVRYFTSLMINYLNVVEVRVLGLNTRLVKQNEQTLSDLANENTRIEYKRFLSGVAFIFLLLLALVLLFYRTLARVEDGSISIGDIAILGLVISRLSRAAETTISSSAKLSEFAQYATTLRQFLTIPPEDNSNRVVNLDKPIQKIEFRNVTFTYPDATQPSLKHVSFVINPEETVAIVGENGAGKTTIVKLILQIYMPDEGEILINDIPATTLSRNYLYHNIGLCLQHFVRFEGSVRENIAYGNLEMYVDNQQKVEALTQDIKLHDTIQRMPQSYDTHIGREFGVYMPSGGQWQQIAIARAFARDAGFVIFDEPTASLDPRAEYEMFSEMLRFLAKRTVILISHRFSTVSLASRILVFERGEVTEQGTHQELLAINGTYATLYSYHQQQMSSLE